MYFCNYGDMLYRSAGTGEEREAEVLREFEQLSQMLRGLKELPLNMQNIQVFKNLSFLC